MRRPPRCATLGYASGYAGSSNPKAIELAERLAKDRLSRHQPLLFHLRRRRVHRLEHQDGPLLLEAQRQAGKFKVISRMLGYHGVTLEAAMCATGISAYWPMFEPRLRIPGFSHIPSPYPYRYEAPEGVSQGIAAANEAGEADPRRGTRHRRDVHRGAGAGGGRRRDLAAGRLLPAHPRDLRSVRRAALLRRGHHRLRAHRPRCSGSSTGACSPTSCSTRRRSTSGYFPLGCTKASA